MNYVDIEALKAINLDNINTINFKFKEGSNSADISIRWANRQEQTFYGVNEEYVGKLKRKLFQ